MIWGARHSSKRPDRQRWQVPQFRPPARTTRSPCAHPSASSPFWTTVPNASCPGVTGSSTGGKDPSSRWTSDVQMPQASTFTSTSSGPGLGTPTCCNSSSCPGPMNRAASIVSCIVAPSPSSPARHATAAGLANSGNPTATYGCQDPNAHHHGTGWASSDARSRRPRLLSIGRLLSWHDAISPPVHHRSAGPVGRQERPRCIVGGALPAPGTRSAPPPAAGRAQPVPRPRPGTRGRRPDCPACALGRRGSTRGRGPGSAWPRR